MKGAIQGRTLGSVPNGAGPCCSKRSRGPCRSNSAHRGNPPGGSRFEVGSRLGSRTGQGPAASRGAGGRAVRTQRVATTHLAGPSPGSRLGSRTEQGPAVRRGAGGRTVRTPSIAATHPGGSSRSARLGAERSRALLLDVEPGAAPSEPGHLVAMPGGEATATSVPLVSNSGGPPSAPRTHAPRRSNRGDRLRSQGVGRTELIGDRAGPTRGSNEHRQPFCVWIRSGSRRPSIRSVGGVAQPWR